MCKSITHEPAGKHRLYGYFHPWMDGCSKGQALFFCTVRGEWVWVDVPKRKDRFRVKSLLALEAYMVWIQIAEHNVLDYLSEVVCL